MELGGDVLESLGGLEPRAMLLVGPGYSREDIKAVLLGRGIALSGDAVSSPQGLAAKILGVKEDQILAGSTRQEVLRLLLAEPRIGRDLTELRKLRRQSLFFKKLDRSLQAGRLAFAHEEELRVQNERLLEKQGGSPIRAELLALSRAYEAWLQATGYWDPPRLFREARERLRSGAELGWPEKILLLSAQAPESLEQDFWDEVARHTRFERLGPPVAEVIEKPRLSWERWHTLDDAAERLVERLEAEAGSGWDRAAVLLPDLPAVRRTVVRALERQGLPIADPRDPTRIRLDEATKWAILPLELVARDFERAQVVSWARFTKHLECIQEIAARGIRGGLAQYRGGSLSPLHSTLLELRERFERRMTAQQLGERHLELLRSWAEERPELGELPGFFERVWAELRADLETVEIAGRRAPLRHWVERLRSRLEEMSPAVAYTRARKGVQLFRLSQAPFGTPVEKLWIFGMPSGWLGGDGVGDYWYSENERAALATEFLVRSSTQVAADRKACLLEWLGGADEAIFLDAEYDWDGRERESALSALWELGWETGEEPQSMGSHSRLSPSHGGMRPVPALEALLPPRESGKPDLRATELDRFSRCGFQALAQYRWRLQDIREPGPELWADARGNILHMAAQRLIETRNGDGTFGILPRDALEEAWAKLAPQGLFQGARLQSYVKARLLPVLETFCAKEREYAVRSGTQVLSQEGPELRLDFKDFSLRGRPDRIDEHPDGLFILDYKTSSSLPKGTEMMNQGYRLQLPFYAVAARAQLGKPVLGIQFVELNRKGGRGNGIFFKHYNGKNPGSLTQSRSRTSLFEMEPDEAWARCQEQLIAHAQDYLRGAFRVRPKLEKECRACFYEDLCGARRAGSLLIGTQEEGGEASGDSTLS